MLTRGTIRCHIFLQHDKNCLVVQPRWWDLMILAAVFLNTDQGIE